ncbi:MAG: RnfABCDGE type electron transport complex subunit B [Candidatus Margulisbacteria bacterium]|jgi:Na+-translocating ferredoxin:NAD+ oxidoreductase RNF subunit RnfB|nr:RnfABCDGE type electron transport complex subunit B [Candidatus Margulisiibacteriota bacterium]
MILTSIIVLGALGFVFAALLALAADYFAVAVDPRVSAIIAIVPGANCGACGAGGCHDFAERVAKGEIAVSGCVVGGAEVAKKIAEIMGTAGFTVHKRVAAVHCGADNGQRWRKANYYGVKSCKNADLVASGGLMCSYGCLGYGDCFCVCAFDAIKMVNGLPQIDPEKCTACGKCVTACPRAIISLRPYDFPVRVACSSHDGPAATRKNCPVGCIACKICEKTVPDVFKVVDNLAVIDYTKTGVDCGPAIVKCPTKCILQGGKNEQK